MFSSIRSRPLFAISCIAIAFIASCASGNHVVSEDGPGFFLGALHGFFAPFSLIGSLFSDDIGIYAVHNEGWLYDAGFMLGLAVCWRGGGEAANASRGKPADTAPEDKPTRTSETDEALSLMAGARSRMEGGPVTSASDSQSYSALARAARSQSNDGI